MFRRKQAPLAVGLVLAAAGIWWVFRQTVLPGFLGVLADQVTSTATVFLSIIIEAIPFLLLGTLVSGLVEVFVNEDDIARFIPHDPIRGALVGALLGLCFPVCDCGVVPLTRRLFRKGIPVSVGIAFLLAAPMFNPIAIASTAAAFGIGPILFWRMGLTVVIAGVTGVVFSAQAHPEKLLRPLAWAPIQGGSGLEGTPAVAAFKRPPLWEGLRQAATIMVDEFFEMGRYLVLGTLLASLMQTLVPQSALLTVSAGPVISVITLTILAIVLSICSTVDAFVALAFARTFTSGSVLAFLVFGPMVDVKNTLMFLSVFRRKTVAYLILLPLLMVILAGVFINLNLAW